MGEKQINFILVQNAEDKVCSSCYVEAVDMSTDCEETEEAEEDLDFL